MGVDVVDRQLYGGDLLCFLIRDFGLELLLEGHYQLYRVERIGAKIVNERGFEGHFILFDTQLLYDNFPNSFYNIAHFLNFLMDEPRPPMQPMGYCINKFCV